MSDKNAEGRREYHPFTEREIQTLKELWPEHTREEIRDALSVHPYGSILGKAGKLRLRKSKTFLSDKIRRAQQVRLASCRANPAQVTTWKRLAKQIKQRDSYRCQDCNSYEDLIVHHHDNDNTNDEPSNLITLCRACHLRKHYEGIGPFLSESRFEDFLNNHFMHLKVEVRVALIISITILGVLLSRS